MDRNILTPIQIKKQLDRVVVNQDHAKKVLAIEIYKHFLKLVHENDLHNSRKIIKNSNILMTGTTGTGKTLLAETLSKILKVPFAIADCTSLTEAGYVGNDVENVLLGLIKASDYDIESAQRGIIYLDEIDKIGRKGENTSITRDVSGEGVQQALLKIIEGTIASVPPLGGRKHPREECIEIDTSNILFLAGGAFEGIEDIVKNRFKKQSKKQNIGFSMDTNDKIDARELTENDLRNNITKDDLRKFGLLPELLGRFSVVTNLQSLGKEDLVHILKLKTGIISEYQTVFELQNKQLKINDDALEEIANVAIKDGTGARGLRSVIDKVMEDIMFTCPSTDIKEYIITRKDILEAYKNNINYSTMSA